jgi:hypothetical protein
MLNGDNGGILPLRVFGCVCFVRDNRPTPLDPRAVKCVFLGYSATQKGCVLEPKRKKIVCKYGCDFPRV